MKKILIILGILIVILFLLLYFQKSKKTDETGIKIIHNNKVEILTFSKLNSFEKISFTTARGDKFSGYDLTAILNSKKIPADSKTTYSFHSNDGGTLNVNKEESEFLYLIFQDDYIRLVIPSDEFSQRWMKYISEIEIK
ncbi:MAG: hypothetical protein P9L97_02800 [Candidatus Tenebribacter davisii]|jgi:hypothetical protein|nr:hypothetical protein [Candidatus Tenebribacter davisii]